MRRLIALIWAAPYSLLGLVAGALIYTLRGGVRVEAGCLEFALRPTAGECPGFLRRCPYRAITLGHIILAFSSAELQACRAHEHVHVRQYERWGVFFGPAYLACSAWQLARGRDVYWDNCFEVQGRRLS